MSKGRRPLMNSIITIAIFCGFGYGSALVRKRKGGSFRRGFILGVLFLWFGLIFVLLTKPGSKERDHEESTRRREESKRHEEELSRLPLSERVRLQVEEEAQRAEHAELARQQAELGSVRKAGAAAAPRFCDYLLRELSVQAYPSDVEILEMRKSEEEEIWEERGEAEFGSGTRHEVKLAVQAEGAPTPLARFSRKTLDGLVTLGDSIETPEAPPPLRGSRPVLWVASAILAAILVPAVIWLRADIVDPSVCGRGGLGFRDSRSEIGVGSWVSVPLPVARARGVRIHSYRVVGDRLAHGDVLVKVADHRRWENGRRTGIDFRGASYGSQPEAYLPGITRFLEDPVGVPLRVLPGARGAAPGTSFHNVALFVRAARASEGTMIVDLVEMTFRSGIRSQTCEVPVNFTLGTAKPG